MNTKPFDPTKPVQQRCGLPAEILCTDLSGVYPIAAKLTAADGKKYCAMLRKTGHMMGAYNESPEDLVNIPVKREGWVNLYPSRVGGPLPGISGIWATREEADSGVSNARIACVRIEWTE